jgi:hypothetical protein
MKWFSRFVAGYFCLVCLLVWLRDKSLLTVAVILTALFVWAMKRGWLLKIVRSAAKHIRLMTRSGDEQSAGSTPFKVISHTTNFIDRVQVRPLEFYSVLEQKIAAIRIPNIRCSRMCMREGGPFSPQREYLHVKRKDLEFSICGAPFGTGFFVSQRLIRWIGLTAMQKFTAVCAFLIVGIGLVKLLGIGAVVLLFAVGVAAALYIAFSGADTAYQADTAESFKRAVLNAIRETTNELTVARPISGSYYTPNQPLMGTLFQ